MKIKKIRKITLNSGYEISLMEYKRKPDELNFSHTSYEIWESKNDIKSYWTDNKVLAFNKYEEICEKALEEECRGE